MILKIYDKNPSERALDEAVRALERGGVIIYPTDSVYAFGCSLLAPKGIEALRRLNGRAAVETAVMFDSLSQISEYCRMDNDTFRLLKRNLPGGFVFQLTALSTVPDKAASRRKAIGVRIPDNSVARAIVGRLGCPMLTAPVPVGDQTEYSTDPELIEERFGGEVALVVNGGIAKDRTMTVVDLTGDEPSILQQGESELV